MLITLLSYYSVGDIVWLCVYLFKCLLPYYLITIGYIVWLCVYISLNAYYLITLLLSWWYSMAVCTSL